MKVLCVLYDDPVAGYPQSYPRANIPQLQSYPDGQSLPNPQGLDFIPGTLLGSVSGELGLRSFLEQQGHNFVVTADKDSSHGVFEQELIDADIVISQPFWPAYLTKERLSKARNLKLAITAGVGSDHVDLQAACKLGITVAEVTYSNSNSVAEHVVMLILNLVRNYLPSHAWVKQGGWNIADCASRAYDLEGMHVGVIGAGRIGRGVLKRLQAFDVHLHYTDKHRLNAADEASLHACYHANILEMLQICDVITINCPLDARTEGLFNQELINQMKPGSYLINTARAKICEQNAIAQALENGKLAGYAGDVWFPQPPHQSHPWRTMPHHGMTPHVSGTTLSAQARYAAGVREILECWFAKRPIRDEYLIVAQGKPVGTGAHSYSVYS